MTTIASAEPESYSLVGVGRQAKADPGTTAVSQSPRSPSGTRLVTRKRVGDQSLSVQCMAKTNEFVFNGDGPQVWS